MINFIPKQLIFTILIIILIFILLSFLNFYLSIRPGKWPIEFTPENFNLKYENVTFESDNLKLKGWFIPAKSNKTIIVMHGYPTNKADVLPFSLFLLKKYSDDPVKKPKTIITTTITLRGIFI